MNPSTQPGFETRIVDESAMPASLDVAIRDLLCECFPADVGYFRHQRGWNGSHPAFSVVTTQGERLVGHLSVVWRSVLIGGAPALVGGVQNVCVSPDFRGRGILSPLMQKAADESRSRGAPFGLLFCLPVLEPTYQRCGWSRISPRRMVARDAAGAMVDISSKSVVMSIDLAGRPFPEGDLDLNGPDW